jgi:hypothetical protein
VSGPSGPPDRFARLLGLTSGSLSRVSPSRAGSLRAATVRHYLEALREKRLVTAATELTYREPLADFNRPEG